MPSWLKIFAVFNNASVALIVVLLFISCCIVWFFFTAFDLKPLSLVTTYVIGYHLMLCGGNLYSANKTTTRIYLFFCMICSMLVSLHYLSFYIAFMISPRRENQVVSVNELIAKEFQLTGDLETLSMVNKSGKVGHIIWYILFEYSIHIIWHWQFHSHLKFPVLRFPNIAWTNMLFATA